MWILKIQRLNYKFYYSLRIKLYFTYILRSSIVNNPSRRPPHCSQPRETVHSSYIVYSFYSRLRFIQVSLFTETSHSPCCLFVELPILSSKVLIFVFLYLRILLPLFTNLVFTIYFFVGFFD